MAVKHAYNFLSLHFYEVNTSKTEIINSVAMVLRMNTKTCDPLEVSYKICRQFETSRAVSIPNTTQKKCFNLFRKWFTKILQLCMFT